MKTQKLFKELNSYGYEFKQNKVELFFANEDAMLDLLQEIDHLICTRQI